MKTFQYLIAMTALLMAPEPEANGGGGAGAGAGGNNPNPGAGASGGSGGDFAWRDGIQDQSLRDYVTTKGWVDVPSALESYRNLEKLAGGPKEKLLRVPDNFDDEKTMTEIYDKLGRPKEAKDYTFKSADPKMDAWMKDNFHKLGLNDAQGKKLLASYDSLIEQTQKDNDAKFKADLEANNNALKTKWGSAYEQNVKVAKSGAAQFGISEEHLAKLEETMGFGATMEFLHKIGSKIGEATFHNADGGSNSPSILTPEQASQKISDLTKDKEFYGRLMRRESAAVAEWDKLNKMAIGEYKP